MADKVVIGIHGLANKPPKAPHEADWVKSIQEGLDAHCGGVKLSCPFELVYWADCLYANPLHNNEDFQFDSNFDDEPYRTAKELGTQMKEYKEGVLDAIRVWGADLGGDAIDKAKSWFGMDALADLVLSDKLKDLAFYYDDKKSLYDKEINDRGQAAKILRGRLQRVLEKHKGKDICLVSHSMGTIISYDVLRLMGRPATGSPIPVSHFITLGSPLGLPHVKHKILTEAHDSQVRTPTIVSKSWVNFADRRDPVALDVHLNDDYRENGTGVRVKDDLVFNDYVSPYSRKENAHKIFGYLRCPEFSKHLATFLK